MWVRVIPMWLSPPTPDLQQTDAHMFIELDACVKARLAEQATGVTNGFQIVLNRTPGTIDLYCDTEQRTRRCIAALNGVIRRHSVAAQDVADELDLEGGTGASLGSDSDPGAVDAVDAADAGTNATTPGAGAAGDGTRAGGEGDANIATRQAP